MRCFNKTSDFGLKIMILFLAVCIGLCILLIVFFESEIPTKATCIVKNKINSTYSCQGVFGHRHYTDCGPTINYKTEYLLTETKSMISKMACCTQTPDCYCCKESTCEYIRINNKKINGCFPIIVQTLEVYQSIVNGSLIDCWIDGNGNYLMKEQIQHTGWIMRIVLILILAILFIWLCVSVYVLYKRLKEKRINENTKIINSVELDYGPI